jgi:predicted dehydrogenase
VAASDLVRWGVLGTAGIATRQVIPAMQRGRYSRVTAIASRDHARAAKVAADLGIAKAHGSYDDLLGDRDVDAVYIPLPNHLHLRYSMRALEAAKHVLCEKPIGLSAAEAEALVRGSAAHPQLKVMEAFMYRFHPQWERARRLAIDGTIGEARAVHTSFAYFNNDPRNIRNLTDAGGGALMDIGCYGISIPRFIFGREPRRVSAVSELDPQFGTDRLTSATLDFDGAVGTFTCATQLARHQRVDILGTAGRIEVEIPVNPLADRPSRIWLQRGASPAAPSVLEEIVFEPCNQYTLQGDAVSLAIITGTSVPTPLSDAVANMRAIDAAKASADGGGWIDL